jgi:hypothetical protein
MKRLEVMTIKRDDGTTVRLPAPLWGDMTDLAVSPYHAFGLYAAIACWSQGAPFAEVLWFSENEVDDLNVINLLVIEGHIAIRDGRYHAQNLTVIA